MVLFQQHVFESSSLLIESKMNGILYEPLDGYEAFLFTSYSQLKEKKEIFAFISFSDFQCISS